MVLSNLLGDSRYAQESSSSLEKEYAVDSARVLGTGISGPVRLAVHRQLGTTHAVKSFLKRFASPTELAAFKTEVEFNFSMDHPLIVRVERVFETRKAIHMVMEHLKGGELFDYVVRKGRVAEEDGVTALRQMLTAVDHLHGKGIVHLDIKLENFVHASDDCKQLKLIDFGYASRCDKGKLSGLSGSLLMMAPEMLKGKYDSRADLWSVGVSAYMMLCGSSPWAHNDIETRCMISAGRPLYREEFFRLSADAQDFIRSLLTARPAERPSAKDMLNHRWILGNAKQVPSAGLGEKDEEKDGMSESTTADGSSSPVAMSESTIADSNSPTADGSSQDQDCVDEFHFSQEVFNQSA